MQQFIVPQFIEVEDKIFGPITVRQFTIILLSGVVVFLAYRFADFALFVFTLVLVGGFSLILAFVKINGQAFHYFLLNIIQTLRRPSVRIWRKKYDKKDLEFLRKSNVVEVVEKKVHKVAKRGHIRDLALLVNTGGFYKPEDDL
jgi:hypothetical protein